MAPDAPSVRPETTPTPWKTEHDPKAGTWIAQEGDGIFRSIACMIMSYGSAKADAELIVAAVNERAELIAALQGMVGLIQLLPDAERRPLLDNHRYRDAYALVARITGASS